MTQITYVRDFNGVDDNIEVAVDGMDAAYSAMSLAIIIKPDSIVPGTMLARDQTGATSWQFLTQTINTFGVWDDVSTVTRRPPDGYLTTAMGWVLMAATKASGLVPWRWHRYRYDLGTWDHQDDDANTVNFVSTTSTRVFIGGDIDGTSENYDGKIACLGLWQSVALSDANLEGMVRSVVSWERLSPNHLWLLNQPVTTATVVDRIGAADQIALNGTAVVAESNLPFDDGGVYLYWTRAKARRGRRFTTLAK